MICENWTEKGLEGEWPLSDRNGVSGETEETHEEPQSTCSG